jgi:DNA-binding Lrp family transcriptional regulator
MNLNNVAASQGTFDKVLSNPLERSNEVEEYIEQSVLPKRYGISKSTLSYRISKLGIKSFKRGRTCYLNSKQVELLDKLDKFCQTNDGARIEKFFDSLEPLADLDKVCNPYAEQAENVIERSNEMDASVLKGLIEECLSLLNQSLSQNQIIESERQLWINHAVNSDQTINEQKQRIAELETSYLMQVENTNRMLSEIDQLRNALALLNRNSQGEKVVNFVSRQHQQKIPPYNPKTMNSSS